MAGTISEQKKSLRAEVKKALAAIPGEQRLSASARACALLSEQALWQRVRSVLFYAPLPGELDVWPLLNAALCSGKRVALPRYSPTLDLYVPHEVCDPLTQVQAARFGIREPVEGCLQVSLNRLDLILVPGVAFDLHGRRLGRGTGYYDRLLSPFRGKTCGVAFDEQVVNELPVESHDVLLNCILTPTRWCEL